QADIKNLLVELDTKLVKAFCSTYKSTCKVRFLGKHVRSPLGKKVFTNKVTSIAEVEKYAEENPGNHTERTLKTIAAPAA
ncbi:MAG: hypothetical protein K0U12_00740, partial [Gammaproteobacteria bacterium]|nr:hypothetical protein [Gammaproteobacteria bacterium]